MEIVLNNEEFNEAVICYLEKKGFSTSAYDISVSVIQGRNGNGTRAEIALNSKGTTKPVYSEPVESKLCSKAVDVAMEIASTMPTDAFIVSEVEPNTETPWANGTEVGEPKEVKAESQEPENKPPYGKLFGSIKAG